MINSVMKFVIKLKCSISSGISENVADVNCAFRHLLRHLRFRLCVGKIAQIAVKLIKNAG